MWAGESKVPPAIRGTTRATAGRLSAPVRVAFISLCLSLPLALALGIALAGCQPCGSCDMSTLNTRLISGTVMTSMGSNPSMQFTLSPGSGVSIPAGCFLAAATVVAPNGQVQASQGPLLNCNVNGVPILLYLTALNDLRGMKAGIGQGMLNVIEPASGDSTCTKGGSSTSLFDYDVTRADGGTAAYPMLVTSDYVRDVSVHFSITVSTSCGPLAVAGDIELAQKASDVRQNSGCACE